MTDKINEKQKILDAWILIEELSEGQIVLDSKKENLQDREFAIEMFGYENFFKNFITWKGEEVEKLSDKEFEKCGLVMYFGIFNFEEITVLLREEIRKLNNIEWEEDFDSINNSIRFTLAIYFDNQLNFQSKKTFFTASGYFHKIKKLPENLVNLLNIIKKQEDELNNKLEKEFNEKSFNDVFRNLCSDYNVDEDNFRYAFIKNLEFDNDVNLHSFYIEDLEKAKKINESKNLDTYFKSFEGSRGNLDTNTKSNDFNIGLIREILQPNNYPLGRFPRNSDYSLYLMQQVAVNLALENDNEKMMSVNGPPGTGKTTLLNDIFADLIVQQAYEIINLGNNKTIQGQYENDKPYKLGRLPFSIANKNIVVASSNNGAVQKIVNELPLIEGISDEFIEKIKNADYFMDISNAKIENNDKEKDENIIFEKGGYVLKKEEEDINWGCFSMQGGSSSYIYNMNIKVEAIVQYLYDQDPKYNNVSTIFENNAYSDFKKKYKEVKDRRDSIQCYYEFIKTKNYFEALFEENEKILEKKESISNSEIEKIEGINKKLDINLESLKASIKFNEEKINRKQQELNVLILKKPILFGIRKVFNSSKVNKYLEEITLVNNDINEFSSCLDNQNQQLDELNKNIKENDIKIAEINQELDNFLVLYQQNYNICISINS